MYNIDYVKEIETLKKIFQIRPYRCGIPNKFVNMEFYGKDSFSLKNENSDIENIDTFNKNHYNTVMWPIDKMLNVFRLTKIQLAITDIKDIYSNINKFIDYIKNVNPMFLQINKDFLPNDLYLKELEDFSQSIYDRLDLKNYNPNQTQDSILSKNINDQISKSAILKLFEEKKKEKELQEEENKKMHDYYYLNSSR